MDTLVNFILEAAISLGLLSLFYLTIARRYNSPQFNRFYLIFSLIFSVIVPFLSISISSPQEVTTATTAGPAFVMLDMVTVYGDVMAHDVIPVVKDSKGLQLIYLIGFIVLAFRLIYALIKLNILTGKSKMTRVDGHRVIITGANYQPFTFLQTMVIPKNVWESAHQKEVLIHESIHVKQKHSIDLILLELILIIQWFNPFAWLMRRLMQENHEFLADKAVIAHGFSVKEYQKLLLYEVMGVRFELGNNFNHSLTKKRLKMMTLKISKKRSLLSSLLSVVLISGLFFVFACESEPEAYVNPETAFVMNGQLVQPQEILTDAPGQAKNIVRVEIDGEEHFLKPELTEEDMFNTKTLTIDEAKKRYKDLAFGPSVNKVLVINKQVMAEEELFIVVESMPSFPGGQDSLMRYLAKTLRYPVIAQKNGIQGRVFIQFVVDKDGSVRDVETVRGVDPSLDAEAMRVVQAMPPWVPGMQRGKKVNVRFMLPINFALQGDHGVVVVGDVTVKNSTMKASTNVAKSETTDERIVSGTITDDKGEPIPGASVISRTTTDKGFSKGVVSDKDGAYSFTIGKEASEVIISYVGKETIKIKLGEMKN